MMCISYIVLYFQSYSLRPTAKAKSTVLPGGPANGKVTAILKRANEIRQVSLSLPPLPLYLALTLLFIV